MQGHRPAYWHGLTFDFRIRPLLINPNINRSLDKSLSGRSALMRETLTKAGKLGLRLLEDLTALAAGGSVCADLKLV